MRWTQEGYLEDLVIERSAIWLDLWNEQLMKRGNVPNPKQNQLDKNWNFRYFFSRFNFRAKVVQWSTRFPLQSRLSGRDFLLRILSSGTGADRESGSTGPAKTRIHPEGLDTRPTLRAETTVSIPNLKNNIFLMLLRHWDRSLEKSYYYLLI